MDNDDAAKYVQEPHPHDILTGENGKVHANHKGNVFFLKLLVSDYNDWVASNKHAINGSDESDAKKLKQRAGEESAKRIVDKIKSRNPPGRFLKREEDAASKRKAVSSSKSNANNNNNSNSNNNSRWQTMEDEESMATTKAYFHKVREELEKQVQNKNKRLQQGGEEIGRKKKKAKTRTRSDSNATETDTDSQIRPEELIGDSKNKLSQKDTLLGTTVTANANTNTNASNKNNRGSSSSSSNSSKNNSRDTAIIIDSDGENDNDNHNKDKDNTSKELDISNRSSSSSTRTTNSSERLAVPQFVSAGCSIYIL